METTDSVLYQLTGGEPIKGEVTVKIDMPTIAILGITIFVVVLAATVISKRL